MSGVDAQLFFGCGPEICADIDVACGDLITGNELSTSLLISLFTDRRANDDDKLPDGTDPRGWWADAMDGYKWGSRLWLLERARNLKETLRLAEDYANEALQWLVKDGVAKKVAVTAYAIGDCKNTLGLHVEIFKPDGKSLKWKYRYAWDLRHLQECELVENFCI
jgi:phage gp46-like protein